MAVDRENRDALVAAINRYLDGQTTAFQFDGEIFGIKSDDSTVSLDPKDYRCPASNSKTPSARGSGGLCFTFVSLGRTGLKMTECAWDADDGIRTSARRIIKKRRGDSA